jgi:simple sugar transport system permease protein
LFALFTIFEGALGNADAIGRTLNLTAILLLTGLATMIAFTSGVFNVGMEGQLYLGALATVATVVALHSYGFIASPLAAVAGMAAGASYAFIPASLKAKVGLNEIVSTLLLNYVALFLVDYFAAGPIHQQGAALNITVAVPLSLRLPILGETSLNPSIVVAILASVGMAFLIYKTKFGFEARMMAGNIRSAKYIGVNIPRNIVLSMVASGALAGLAGSMLVLGITFAWFAGASKFYGYLGIGVALLANLNPIAIIFSAFFFSVLNEGGIAMQGATGVPYEVAQSIAAMIIVVALVRTALERRATRAST